MITNVDIIAKFERDFIAGSRLTHSQSLRIIESLWNEGVKLGTLPPKDPFEGLETDFKIARALNSCLKKSSPG
jgi:hypothetical protein